VAISRISPCCYGRFPQSALTWFALRELASRRFDDFVRELARFNELFGGH
jgi:hypothetical protein